MNARLHLQRDADIAIVAIDNPRATNVDVVLVDGCGFPRWEGGPVFCARDRGAETLAAELDNLARVSGPGFVRSDLRHVLEVCA